MEDDSYRSRSTTIQTKMQKIINVPDFRVLFYTFQESITTVFLCGSERLVNFKGRTNQRATRCFPFYQERTRKPVHTFFFSSRGVLVNASINYSDKTTLMLVEHPQESNASSRIGSTWVLSPPHLNSKELKSTNQSF